MKLKRILAGFMAGTLVVTGLPFMNLGTVTASAADNTSETEEWYRYHAVSDDNLTIDADWENRGGDASLDQFLNDSPDYSVSRLNTGGIPHATAITENNDIFIRMTNGAKSVNKMVYVSNDDGPSGGNAANLPNGAITECTIYATTAAVDESTNMGEVQWTKVKDVNFDSNNSTAPAHDIAFEEALTGVTALRMQVRHTSGSIGYGVNEADTYIAGAEVEVFSSDQKIANSDLAFTASFDCHADNEVTKMNDGDRETIMHSRWANEGGTKPVKYSPGYYFENNNLYLTLKEEKSLGRLRYIAGSSNGTIQNYRIYVSAVDTDDPKTIDESGWLLVKDGSNANWAAYSQGNNYANSRIADFDSVQMAKHVRLEVLNTVRSTGATNPFNNSYISGRRLYVYETEPVNQEETVENIATSASVRAWAGSADGTSQDNVLTEDDTVWQPALNLKGSNVSGTKPYIVLDLKSTSLKASSLQVLWDGNSWATDYKIETADTCLFEGDVTGDGTKADESTAWTTVASLTRDSATGTSNPIDTFGGDEGEALSETTLKRYLRITVNGINSGANADSVKIKGIKINCEVSRPESVKNVALASTGTTVRAWTGTGSNAGTSLPPELAIDGLEMEPLSNPNTNNRWQSTVDLKTGNKPNYIVLDLGENTYTELSSIAIRWHKKTWASAYKIQTAYACQEEGSVTTGDAPSEEGWTTVAEYNADTTGVRKEYEGSGKDSADEFPLDEFAGETLAVDRLERFVRIVATGMNSAAAVNGISIKEIEIMGVRRSGTVNAIELNLKDPVIGMQPTNATTPTGTNYVMVPDNAEGTLHGTTWSPEVTEDGFAMGQTYTATMLVRSKYPFADNVTATVNGEEATSVINNGWQDDTGFYRATVTYTFSETENPTDAWSELKNLVAEKKSIKDEGNTNNKYTARSWAGFEEAYDAAATLVSGDAPTGNIPTSTYVAAKKKLEEESATAAENDETTYKGLKLKAAEQILALDHLPDVSVAPPTAGQSPADADLTYGGGIQGFTVEYGTGFGVDADGAIQGKVTFPNDGAGNDVFDTTDQFMIYLKLNMKEQPTYQEAIVGKLNKQYNLQIFPQGNGSVLQFCALMNTTENGTATHWLTMRKTVGADFFGEDVWHDIVCLYNKTTHKLELYVDGSPATERAEHASRTGYLRPDSDSTFTIGHNLHADPNGNGPEGNTIAEQNEWFTGKFKNFQMYIGDDFPEDTLNMEGIETDEARKKHFADIVEDDANESTVSLDTVPVRYDVTSTVWEPADEVFDIYKEYKVTVKLETLEDSEKELLLPEKTIDDQDVSGAILRSGDGTIYEGATVTKDSTGTGLTFTHTFQAAEHPVEALKEYLQDTLPGLVDTDALDANEKDGTRVYTKAAWTAFQEVYEAAQEAAESEKIEGTVSECQTALTNLQNAVNTLNQNKAADTCECMVGTITMTGKTIDLTTVSAQEQLEAQVTVNYGDCMKHSASNLPAAEPVYTIAEGSTEGIASINGSTLTVTGEGTVNVAVSITLKDGDRSVDTKTSDTPAVYTVTSPMTDDVTDLQAAVDGIAASYNEDDYTADSWKDLQDALDAANDLLKTVKDGGEISVSQMLRAIEAINDAKEALVTKGSESGDSEQALRDLVISIGENKKKEDYTADSWNAMVEIYNQAVELLKSANPDPAKCAELLKQLKDAEAKLVTTAQDQADAKAEAAKAVADADAVMKAGKGDYSDASWNAFVAAYNAAKNAPANADAATLRKLAKALSDAQKALVKDTVVLNNIQYKVVDAGKKTATVVAGMNKKAKKITIPATVTIDKVSYNVVSINANAFKGYNKATKATIGKNVTTIGKNAFSGCKKLKNVVIKSSVLTTVHKTAFKKTAKGITAKVPKKLKKKAAVIKKIKKAGIKKIK